MKEIMLTSQKMIHASSGAFGIPASGIMLLRTLMHAGRDGIGVMELAHELDIDAAAVTRMVKKAEKDGFATRKTGKDRRRSYIRLTAQGYKAFAGFHKTMHEFERGVAKRAGRKKIKTAMEILGIFRKELIAFSMNKEGNRI